MVCASIHCRLKPTHACNSSPAITQRSAKMSASSLSPYSRSSTTHTSSSSHTNNLRRSRSIGFTTRVVAVPFSGIARASQVVDYLQVEWPWDEPLRWGPGGSDILTIQGYRPSKFKVLFAPTERASGCKNFPRAGITAISNSSFPSMFSRMVMMINPWGGIGVLAGYFIQVSVWTVQTSGSFTLGVI